MIALALDTSGPVGSVAVVGTEGDDDAPRVLASRTIEDGMRRGVELFPAIEAALAEAGVSARQIELVAVGTGPGSYTGLRVGITAARAIAYAAGAELYGVPSCDALAEATPTSDGRLAVVVDARVKAVYVSVYGSDGAASAPRWERSTGPEILPPAEAAARIPAGALVVGDALAAYRTSFDAFRSSAEPLHAGAADVARLALRLRARGVRQQIDEVVPLYLRKTEAERKLEGKLA